MPRIAYFGPEGTFTEAALRGMVAAELVPLTDCEPFPAGSPSAALEMVRAGDADYACVPIENSIEGSVLPTLDSLAAGALLQVFAEYALDMAFTIATRSASPSLLHRRYPGGACPGREVGGEATCRTRGSGRPTPTPQPPSMWLTGRADAAVTTALAAERYGLTALASDVVDEPNARTRFVLVGPPGPPPPSTGADRTSVVLRLENVPGALVAAMTEFADARHRPDPHRIPAHPKGVGYLHLLPRLCRAYRRRRRRRGTQGA